MPNKPTKREPLNRLNAADAYLDNLLAARNTERDLDRELAGVRRQSKETQQEPKEEDNYGNGKNEF